jgi:hypothetical protein
MTHEDSSKASLIRQSLPFAGQIPWWKCWLGQGHVSSKAKFVETEVMVSHKCVHGSSSMGIVYDRASCGSCRHSTQAALGASQSSRKPHHLALMLPVWGLGGGGMNASHIPLRLTVHARNGPCRGQLPVRDMDVAGGDDHVYVRRDRVLRAAGSGKGAAAGR